MLRWCDSKLEILRLIICIIIFYWVNWICSSFESVLTIVFIMINFRSGLMVPYRLRALGPSFGRIIKSGPPYFQSVNWKWFEKCWLKDQRICVPGTGTKSSETELKTKKKQQQDIMMLLIKILWSVMWYLDEFHKNWQTYDLFWQMTMSIKVKILWSCGVIIWNIRWIIIFFFLFDCCVSFICINFNLFLTKIYQSLYGFSWMYYFMV